MKMKKYVWIVLTVLAIAVAFVSCKSCKSAKRNKPVVPEVVTPAEKESEKEIMEELSWLLIQPGRYYSVALDGRRGYVMIDKSEHTHIAGHFYEDTGEAWAEPRSFTAELKKRFVNVTTGDETRKIPTKDLKRSLSIEPYEAPAYEAVDDPRYRKPTYEVKVTQDVKYGTADGYWTNISGFEDKSYTRVVLEGFRKSISKRELDLLLDLYQPIGAPEGKKPLIMFIHGGAFYVGDRQSAPMVGWCRYFTSLGYVCASIDYRIGFLPSKDDIERAGYMALQDAHAAMRFLVSKADEYDIDTDEIYVAGTSAGSITALNLAFMRNDSRPQSSYGKKAGLIKTERSTDLGNIETSGNELRNKFTIRAVANMWGAVNNVDILKNSDTDIISFHGDADQLVPYDHGYPFEDIKNNLGEKLFNEMYGSVQIDKKARQLGLRSKFYGFHGEPHAFHVNKDQSVNNYYYLIRDSISSFFYQEMVPHEATIVPDKRDDQRFVIADTDVDHVSWRAEGGFIIETGRNVARVLWRTDETNHRLFASGTYRNGLGYKTSREVMKPY